MPPLNPHTTHASPPQFIQVWFLITIINLRFCASTCAPRSLPECRGGGVWLLLSFTTPPSTSNHKQHQQRQLYESINRWKRKRKMWKCRFKNGRRDTKSLEPVLYSSASLLESVFSIDDVSSFCYHLFICSATLLLKKIKRASDLRMLR